MNIRILSFFCAALLSLTAYGQAPTPPAASTIPPDAAATATPSFTPVFTPAAPALPAATATAAATAYPAAPAASTPAPVASPSPRNPDDEIDQIIERQIKRHLNFNSNDQHSEDLAWMALPIVFVVFFAIFGMPVLIVAVILYFSFSKNRAMHKTVRMMVEKGQPVPEALLNPPPVVRQRSDLRRGIKWILFGLALMIFFGACSDWDGGAWSLGIIPFMIGLGYVIFWRLDLRDHPAPTPIAPPQPPPTVPPPSSPTV